MKKVCSLCLILISFSVLVGCENNSYNNSESNEPEYYCWGEKHILEDDNYCYIEVDNASNTMEYRGYEIVYSTEDRIYHNRYHVVYRYKARLKNQKYYYCDDEEHELNEEDDTCSYVDVVEKEHYCPTGLGIDFVMKGKSCVYENRTNRDWYEIATILNKNGYPTGGTTKHTDYGEDFYFASMTKCPKGYTEYTSDCRITKTYNATKVR